MRPRRARTTWIPTIGLILILSTIHNTEGCLPAWFRQERSDPEALEGSGEFVPDELYDPSLPTIHEPLRKHRFEHTNHVQEISTSEEDEDDLDRLYGTAPPIVIDEKLESERRRHADRECHGWCFRGGTCHVDIDEFTYEYIGKRCTCPNGHWGTRCDYNYVKRLYSPVKGQGVQVERSSVPALAFILIMMIIAVGITIYTYRKLSRRSSDFKSSSSLSPRSLSHQRHLRRRAGLYGTPDTSGGTGTSPFSPRTPFSPSHKRYGRLAVQWSPTAAVVSPNGAISVPVSLLYNKNRLLCTAADSSAGHTSSELGSTPNASSSDSNRNGTNSISVLSSSLESRKESCGVERCRSFCEVQRTTPSVHSVISEDGESTDGDDEMDELEVEEQPPVRTHALTISSQASSSLSSLHPKAAPMALPDV